MNRAQTIAQPTKAQPTIAQPTTALPSIGLPPETPGWPPAPRLGGALATLALIGGTALLAHLLLRVLPGGAVAVPDASLPLFFLSAVLVAAVAFGFWAGMIAAFSGFATLNYLFTPPLYTFHIAAPQDLFTLLVFLLVAGLAGLLAGRLHDRAEAARARAEALAVLGALSAELANAPDAAAAQDVALRHLAELCKGPAFALRLDEGRPQLARVFGLTQELDAADLAGADRCLRLGRAEPPTAAGWPGSRFGFLPVLAGEAPLALGHGALTGPEGPRRALAIAALAEQLRLALQRLEFADHARAERLRAEAEATRSAVLTSISHDLRTPLATILGAASALRELDGALDPAARTDLLRAIEQEAGRMNGHVTNLLHLTRLELSAQARRDWVDLADIAGAAVARARRSFPGGDLRLEPAPEVPMIRAEGGLLEQAVFNLIDNALHHGRGPVTLRVSAGPGQVMLEVADQGEGPPEPILNWLEGPALRPAPGQRGLGLAVAKAIARHLGGSLTWQGGAFRLGLPQAAIGDPTEAPTKAPTGAGP